MFARNFTCRKCEVNIGEAVEQEENVMSCNGNCRGVLICW